MAGFALRPVRAEDLPRLVEIEASWETSPHWTRAQFERELAFERSVGVVAEVEGRVAGFAFLWVVADEGQVADLAVDPGSARRGLGRALLRSLTGEARRRGCSAVTLEVRADNAAAQALYVSEGFSVVGRRAKIYNGLVDAVLMTRRL